MIGKSTYFYDERNTKEEKGLTMLKEWKRIRIFAPKPKLEEISMKSPIAKDSDEILALKRQLQQQTLELKKEKMRADFYNEMINVAEEMFNIPIRKKVGTKQ